MNFTTPCIGACNQRRTCTCITQREGGECIKDGRPVAEMACAEPEPELSLWQRLWAWLISPDFGGISIDEVKEYVRVEHECKQQAKAQKRT